MKRKSAMERSAERTGLGQRGFEPPRPSDLLPSLGNILLTRSEWDLAIDVFDRALKPENIDAMLQQVEGERLLGPERLETLNRAIRFSSEQDIGPEREGFTSVADAFPICKRTRTINEIRVCIVDQGPTMEIEPSPETVVRRIPLLEVPANVGATQAAENLTTRLDLTEGIEF